MKKLLYLLSIVFFSTQSFSQTTAILSMKDRAKVIDELLEKRVKKLVPELMKREGVDMWIVISREYNEDPVIKTLLPATWLSARRRTILIFSLDSKDSLETLAVARYDVGTVFKKAWDKDKQPNQWERVSEIITQKDPKRIALNYSKHFALADGIVFTDKSELEENVPKKYKKRFVSGEKLAIGWLETRIPDEIVFYRHIVKIAHDIIKEGFSSKAITPGFTTTNELVWWYRERIRELKLTTWFHPSVSIQRSDATTFDHMQSFTKNSNTIQPGDLLHVDFGITYLRLNSDTQQHAYVLKENETDAPDYLKDALKRANRLQDIFTNNFAVGKTGNAILKESRAQAIQEGIKPAIYTHPIGYHGHASGTTLGMWDSQDGVPINGDYPLHLNTTYAIELNAATYVKEWNKEIRIMLEEDAFFDTTGVWYLDGRQKEFLLILSREKHLSD